MAHDVFVSHSVKDKAVAEKIVAHLEAESIRCWVAPRDVVPGADWGESIIDAIESSRIMVLIFSQNANSSSQIKREVERAVDKEVYTIPFRIDDIKPTRSLEYFISTSQWIDAFTPPLENHLDKLVRTARAILARPAEAPVPALAASESAAPKLEIPQLTPTPVPSSPAWMKPAMMVAGLMVVGAAIWAFANQKRPAAEAVTAPVSTVEEAKTTATPADPSDETTVPNEESPAQEVANQPAVSTEPSNAVAEMNKMAPPPDSYGTKNAPDSIPAKKSWSRAEGVADAASKPAEEPAAVVQRYYDSINQRDLAQAYACLSKGFKAQRPLEKFSQIFASTQSIEIKQLQESSRDRNRAVVTTSFVETDSENRAREWERRIFLVREDNVWRINGTQAADHAAAD